MELESWPVSSVLIGTSNHPELLDRAIWRRFDHVMELDLPGQDERVELLNRQLGSLFGNSEIPPDSVIRPISEILSNYSPADICRYSENVKRRVVLKKEEPTSASLHELELYVNDKKVRGKFCYIAKKIMGDAITVRELSNITGLSIAGVHHHISKS
jgi:SpoVK/Ycf46/Vps4 family AAA+-type ATPase